MLVKSGLVQNSRAVAYHMPLVRPHLVWYNVLWRPRQQSKAEDEDEDEAQAGLKKEEEAFEQCDQKKIAKCV